MDTQKKVLYITIGLMGSGKSTWVKQHSKLSGGKVLSSDDIRMELYGTLKGQTVPQKNQEVFKVMQDRLKDFLDEPYTVAYYDATNLSRKKRIQVYTWAKSKGVEVIARVFLKPLEELLAINTQRPQHKQVGEDIIRERYKQLEVPRLDVDCDSVIVDGYYRDFLDEINLNISKSHDSPFHAETIEEHIALTVNNCLEYINTGYYSRLVEVARFHDLGKSVCRLEDTIDAPHKNYFREYNGSYYTYNGHEKVSAMYYLAYMNEAGLTSNKDSWQVLEAIFQHMNAHSGISQKVINRNKLTDSDMNLIQRFKQIDSKSKVLHKDIYDEFNRLKEESKQAHNINKPD